jgi:hypothetical protein
VADTKKDNQYHDPGQDRFERSDASFKTIAIWMAVIVVLVHLVALAVWGYFNWFSKQKLDAALARRSPLLPQGQVAQQIPGPVLQISPAAHMSQFLKEQNATLESYSWVSKEAGVVRIPIDVATSKVLTSGMLKSRAQNPETTGTEAPEGARLPQDSSSGRTFWNLQTLK